MAYSSPPRPAAGVPRGYLGASAASRRSRCIYACPCGERFPVEVWRAVDTRADPEAGRALCAGKLNRGRCPACGVEREVSASVVYHDPIAERLVLMLPDALRHRELEERARYYTRLAADRAPPPEYVRRFEVAFGVAELGALVHPMEPAEGTRVAPPPIDADTPRPDPQGDETPAPALAGAAAQEPEPDTGRTRVRLPVPDARAAGLERWIANREGPAGLLADERVLVCAALGGAELEQLIGAPLELRLQLHRLPSYPLLVVTVLAPRGSDGTYPTVQVPLDVARAAHRALFDAFAREAAITLHLYDADYLPVVVRAVAAPLEENAQRLLIQAKEAFQRIAQAARSFERAVALFQAPSFDRLGRIHVALSDVELGPLDSPAALRQSVATVSRWSEPGAEAYLVETRSFPLAQWRGARAEVVRAAIEQGIHAPRALMLKVLAEAQEATEWPEVLQRQVAAFALVGERIRQNDLSPGEEAENWRLLAAECHAAGVVLDARALRLAQAAERRARTVASGGTDLRTLPVAELVACLERRELRREAALAICERRDLAGIGAVFAAIPKMTRAEANRVLPSLTVFGEAAERHYVEGLRSRKSFVRQGCALALGALGGAAAAETLARQLIDEPTEIWPEVARAVGDLGAAAVMPLVLRLRETDAEGRDRIARALAHVLLRGVRGPVEMLAAGRDPLSGAAARRALELEEEVRGADAEVRGGAPLSENTVVRGFSRRFFDALGGTMELSEDDLEVVDDDADLVDDDPGPMVAESTRPTSRLPRERGP
ncbi:MAG: hypothetical protein EXR72_12325 [Myxococcales bacterium]|nr:hypothetical protein [Myxococcales bacterium]